MTLNVVSAFRNEIHCLILNDHELLTVGPIVNGDFSAALAGWDTEVLGHTPGAVAGNVNALGGFVLLNENKSFFVSANQTFTIPSTRLR